MKKKKICIVISIVILIVSILLSLIFEAEALKIRALGVLIACLIMWISEAVPMFISTLVMICLLPFLKLMSFEEAMANFRYKYSALYYGNISDYYCNS